METWKEIPDWGGLYEVSDKGRVRSKNKQCCRGLRKGRVLKPVSKGGRKYLAVTLADGERRKQFLVHDLVCLAFIGPKPKGKQVRHLDDSGDNALSNLCYGTHQENEADRIRNGKNPKGVSHGMAKLTEADVRAIRGATFPNLRKMAEAFGVTPTHIWNVRARKTWKHINA